MEYISLAGVVLVFVIVASLLYYRMIGGNPQKPEKKLKTRARETIINEANKRLATNSKDQVALQSLADLYFSENNFEKAVKTYRILSSLLTGTGEMDEATIHLRHGLSAAKIGSLDEAFKALMIARVMKHESVEADFYLGYIEYQRKAYDKAVVHFRATLKINPDHTLTVKYLGLCLKKLGLVKEALHFLKSSVDRDPADKELLFELGETYSELGHTENALRIFSHLRPDPQVGPKSALYAATLNFSTHQPEEALTDLEIGLKHNDIPREIYLELIYLMASVQVQLQNLDVALKYLREIKQMEADYKDVNTRIQTLTEFSSNRNLQVYMVAPASEFLILCKALATRYYKNAEVNFLDIVMEKNEYTDIQAEVSTSKWQDVCLFRFIRTNSQVGDTVLRDMYQRIKDMKVGRGVCVCGGDYTQGARQFVEARQIDLVNKEGLLKALSELG